MNLGIIIPKTLLCIYVLSREFERDCNNFSMTILRQVRREEEKSKEEGVSTPTHQVVESR